MRNAGRTPRGVHEPRFVVGAENDPRDLLGAVVLRLPASGPVGAEDDSLDDGLRLLVERKRQRFVEQPGERAADVFDRSGDRGRGRPDSVGVQLLDSADACRSDAPGVQLSIGVQNDGLAELPVQLAVGDQLPEASVEPLIEKPRAVREDAVRTFGNGDREDVRFDLPRQLDLDRDVPHPVADAIRAGFYGVFTKSA